MENSEVYYLSPRTGPCLVYYLYLWHAQMWITMSKLWRSMACAFRHDEFIVPARRDQWYLGSCVVSIILFSLRMGMLYLFADVAWHPANFFYVLTCNRVFCCGAFVKAVTHSTRFIDHSERWRNNVSLITASCARWLLLRKPMFSRSLGTRRCKQDYQP